MDAVEQAYRNARRPVDGLGASSDHYVGPEAMWPLSCENTCGRCWARTSDAFLVRQRRQDEKAQVRRPMMSPTSPNERSSLLVGWRRFSTFHGLRWPGDGQ